MTTDSRSLSAGGKRGKERAIQGENLKGEKEKAQATRLG